MLTKGSVFVTLRQIVQFENYNSTALCSAHINQKRLPILKEKKVTPLVSVANPVETGRIHLIMPDPTFLTHCFKQIMFANLCMEVVQFLTACSVHYIDYRRESFFMYSFVEGKKRFSL